MGSCGQLWALAMCSCLMIINDTLKAKELVTANSSAFLRPDQKNRNPLCPHGKLMQWRVCRFWLSNFEAINEAHIHILMQDQTHRAQAVTPKQAQRKSFHTVQIHKFPPTQKYYCMPSKGIIYSYIGLHKPVSAPGALSSTQQGFQRYTLKEAHQPWPLSQKSALEKPSSFLT